MDVQATYLWCNLCCSHCVNQFASCGLWRESLPALHYPRSTTVALRYSTVYQNLMSPPYNNEPKQYGCGTHSSFGWPSLPMAPFLQYIHNRVNSGSNLPKKYANHYQIGHFIWLPLQGIAILFLRDGVYCSRLIVTASFPHPSIIRY